ncbi:MAG: hypothetical protein H0W67_06040 [Gemmatimonadales bacterium]|nr:hypothetical protein [Gemmatimonadales bacterium]
MLPDQIRRALTLHGLTPATWIPDASGGREVEATIRVARVVEGPALGWHPVGLATSWTEPLAFLDGVQRSEIVPYAGAAPIVVARIAAAVRERRDRTLSTVLETSRTLVIARPSALARAGEALAGLDTLALPEDHPPHPVRDLVDARRALDRARGALEIGLGERYRETGDGWLIVDGSLAESPRWAADPRMIGIAKSHATLPFEGDDLERYLRLPHGQRSSLFEPQTRSLAPVRSWALRLWPWEGRDLLYGLVRIEVAPVNGSPDAADRLSRFLLAERAPVSAPDLCWDRLLYGISAVEQYLRARLV